MLKRFIIPIAAVLAAACSPTPPASAPDTPSSGCTEEAKVCPDGSSVGREGPDCEFAACPGEATKACTEDAKVCPDGSSVGRQGPDCEFAPCPDETPVAH